MKRQLLAVVLVVAFLSAAFAEETAQTWTSKDGRSITAIFSSLDNDEVVVLVEKRLPVSQLSSPSQRLAADLAKQSANKKDMAKTVAALEKQLENQTLTAEGLRTEIKNLKAHIKKLEANIPEKPEAGVLLSLEGTGTKQSKPFVVNSKPQAIAYAYSDTSGFGASHFSVSVYRGNGSVAQLSAVNESAASKKDSTYIYLDPGTYYLKVNAANASWALKVLAAK